MSNPRVSSAVVQIADGRGVTPTEGGDHKSLDTTADMDEEPPLKVEIWTDADAVDGKVDAVAVDGDNKAELQVDAPNVEILQNCTSDEDEDDPAQITVEQNETDIISKTDGDNREVDIEKPEPNMADKKIEADGKKKNHSGGFTATMRAVIQTNPNLPKVRLHDLYPRILLTRFLNSGQVTFGGQRGLFQVKTMMQQVSNRVPQRQPSLQSLTCLPALP